MPMEVSGTRVGPCPGRTVRTAFYFFGKPRSAFLLHFPWNWKWKLYVSLPCCLFPAQIGSEQFPPLTSTPALPTSAEACPSRHSPQLFSSTGFDLMDLFSVKEILGRRESGMQSSYIRMGSFPVVQRTE